MHRIPLLAILLACVILPQPPAAQASEHDQVSVSAPAATGKERLSDKASDEQRVDDCKVPPPRRTRPRPTSCDFRTP
jgi:hypothetical protein